MAIKPQSFKELCERYGKPWESQEALTEFETKHMTLWRASRWEKATALTWPGYMPFKRIYCNREFIPVLNELFKRLHIDGSLCEIHSWGGCWNVRKIRGSKTRYSIHSFGLALDLNQKDNPLGGPVRWTKDFLGIAKEVGFTCGSDFRRLDGMHFQWADNC